MLCLCCLSCSILSGLIDVLCIRQLVLISARFNCLHQSYMTGSACQVQVLLILHTAQIHAGQFSGPESNSWSAFTENQAWPGSIPERKNPMSCLRKCPILISFAQWQENADKALDKMRSLHTKLVYIGLQISLTQHTTCELHPRLRVLLVRLHFISVVMF